MIENTPYYMQMADSEGPFLQASMLVPNPVVGESPIQIVIFGNPALTGLLKTPYLDVFVDAALPTRSHSVSSL